MATEQQQQAVVTDPTPEQRQKIISDSIRGIPDFPKPGILFWDVTTLMLNPTAFKLTIDALYDRYKDQKVDVVAGVSRRAAAVLADVASPGGHAGCSLHLRICVLLQDLRLAASSSVHPWPWHWGARLCPCASPASCQVGACL